MRICDISMTLDSPESSFWIVMGEYAIFVGESASYRIRPTKELLNPLTVIDLDFEVFLKRLEWLGLTPPQFIERIEDVPPPPSI